MGFEIKDHTADVAVAATGPTIEAVFGNIANGLAETMCDEWPDTGMEYRITVSAENQEALLFDYLDELIYRRDIENVLPVDHTVTITERNEAIELVGTFRGIPLTAITAREIKAVTYADMKLTETEEGWEAYVVFDV